MFDYDDAIEVFTHFKKINSKKQIKFLKNLMFDETFVEWLFQPKKQPNLNEMVSGFYAQLSTPMVIQAMVYMIDDVGYDRFNRSHATFLYSLANISIQTNNERLNEIETQRKAGDISGREATRLNDKITKYNHYVAKLLKASRKIIGKDAKRLAMDSHLPKYVCTTALHSVPQYKYIDRFKIGFYLNNLLNNIYSEVEQMGGFNKSVNWRPFFKDLFGKDNTVEVATFILLEGVHRIDKYKNSDDVKQCWDTLTTFALKELNEAPETLRHQMIELYIKRIDKMFANNSFDLRVDLLSVSDDLFPKLSETVDKYADKITAILTKTTSKK